MNKYLYGAAVQGIQDFIFQTNKLKEIVGASELVEQICTSAFDDFGGKADAENKNSILRAAGNIKHIFDKKEDCEKAVREFPRQVMTMAPGITVSQAVVTLKDDCSDYAAQANLLEQRLRTQRNKPVRSMTLGLMAVCRAQRTGLPAVEKDGEDGWLDEASVKKINAVDVKDADTIGATRKLMNKIVTEEKLKLLAKEEEKPVAKLFAHDFAQMEGKNLWIAVIHADGNGMGQIVQAVCKNPEDAKTFSATIDDITQAAAQSAYKAVECKFWKEDDKDKIIPIRPVVLGGDDLTLICRADLAIEFTKAFIENFDKKSEELLCAASWKNSGWQNAQNEVIAKKLTACAGIAFVKSSYPFHYAYNLAETLCGQAKKKAKEINKDLAPSCLMFHKVQDSFVENFDEIVKRELTPQTNLSFEYGPYYIEEKNGTTIKSLLDNVDKLQNKEGNAIKSHLRQWLSLLFDNVDAANQKMKRLRTVNEQAKKLIDAGFENLDDQEKKIPYHDILSLSSILTQDTKKGGSDE
jgi:CRISPR/Cas system-associated protein Cas10 (large subunit of type III CRISPR-Cas system)